MDHFLKFKNVNFFIILAPKKFTFRSCNIKVKSCKLGQGNGQWIHTIEPHVHAYYLILGHILVSI